MFLYMYNIDKHITHKYLYNCNVWKYVFIYLSDKWHLSIDLHCYLMPPDKNCKASFSWVQENPSWNFN